MQQCKLFCEGHTHKIKLFAEEKQSNCHAIIAYCDDLGRVIYYEYVKEYQNKHPDWKNRHVWVNGPRN